MALSKDIAKRLAGYFRQKINGAVTVNENWRKPYNDELMQLFGDMDIIYFRLGAWGSVVVKALRY